MNKELMVHVITNFAGVGGADPAAPARAPGVACMVRGGCGVCADDRAAA